MGITRVTVNSKKEAQNLKSETDWERVDNITDEVIHQKALDDPDTQPLTEEELSKFKKVIHKGDGLYGYDKDNSKK